jgi:hypothetical protein
MFLLLVTSRTFVVVFSLRKLSFFIFICKTHCNRVPETTNFQRVLNYTPIKVFVPILNKGLISAKKWYKQINYEYIKIYYKPRYILCHCFIKIVVL